MSDSTNQTTTFIPFNLRFGGTVVLDNLESDHVQTSSVNLSSRATVVWSENASEGVPQPFPTGVVLTSNHPSATILLEDLWVPLATETPEIKVNNTFVNATSRILVATKTSPVDTDADDAYISFLPVVTRVDSGAFWFKLYVYGSQTFDGDNNARFDYKVL